MEQGKLKIIENGTGFILEKEGKKISIWQTGDQDVWFGAEEKEVCLELDSKAKDFRERATNGILKSLMVSIIGKYMLEDANVESSNLPRDFIDFANKTIIWHANNGNVLKIVYEGSVIRVFLVSEGKGKNVNNVVRVSEEDLEYNCYYQEFLDFFSDIRRVVTLANIKDENNIVFSYEREEVIPEEESSLINTEPDLKKLSLKRLFGRNKKNDSK